LNSATIAREISRFRLRVVDVSPVVDTLWVRDAGIGVAYLVF
jgi:hypothetical protein